MTSYVRCLYVLFLVFLSSSLQTHARDNKFFNKFSPTKSKDNLETITTSPTGSPTRAPAPEPEPEVVEHGYGLYGSESYRYAPTTTDPVKSTTSLVGEEKYVPVEELKEKWNFKEFETGYSNNENEKEMSEYIKEEGSYPENHGNGYGNEHENGHNNGNGKFETEEEDEEREEEDDDDEEEEEYNYKSHGYETQERMESKTLPHNEYDSMEEYEKEQEYKQSRREYLP